MSKKSIYIKYGITYTFFFMLISFFIIGIFKENNRSFLYNPDGYIQHYPTLMYLGDYFRTIIQTIFNGNLSFPMYDFNIGFGESIIPVLNFYGLGDPLTFLSALVPKVYTEKLYTILIFLRLYLAGITFSLYCFKLKNQCNYTLIGTLTYVFCGFSLFSAVRHPFFINPMIHLPLLCIGIENILKNKFSKIFIVEIFLIAISGFYFLYMLTIIGLVYGLIRFTFQNKKTTIKFSKIFFNGFFSYICGLGMSCMILLPSIYGFLNSTRTTNGITIKRLLFYPVNRYFDIFTKTIAMPAHWDYLGMTGISLICIMIMTFSQKKKYNSLKFFLGLAIIFTLVPLFGYIMNGFGYISNRWSFAFSFLASYIVVTTLPELFVLNQKKQAICLGIIMIYGLITFFNNKNINIYNLTGLSMLLLYSILLFSNIGRNVKLQKIFYEIITIIVVLNLSLNGKLLYSSSFNNYVSKFKTSNKTLVETVISTDKNIEEIRNSPYRIEGDILGNQNIPMLLKLKGTSIYFSMINSNLSKFLQELEISPSMAQSYRVSGLDNRTVIESLLSVRYYYSAKNDKVPYGFNNTSNIPDVYINEYALPMMFLYNAFIPKSYFDKLSSLDKQEALLQGIVVDDSFPVDGFIQKQCVFNNKKTNFTLKFKDTAFENNKIKVEKAKGKIFVRFKSEINSEMYLRLNNLYIEPDSTEVFYINVETPNISKRLCIRGNQSDLYFGRKNYLTNLGYYEKEEEVVITLTFPNKGEYNLDKFEVYAYPMDTYVENVTELQEDSIKNVEFFQNGFESTINEQEDKILFVNIPYDKGWKVFIDNKPSQVHSANIGFMAIPVSKGFHHIRFSYTTPGLYMGTIITLISLIIFLLVIILYKKKLWHRYDNIYEHQNKDL